MSLAKVRAPWHLTDSHKEMALSPLRRGGARQWPPPALKVWAWLLLWVALDGLAATAVELLLLDPTTVWVLLGFHQPPAPVFMVGCSGQLGYRPQMYKAWPPEWLYGGCPLPAPHIICEGPNLSLEEKAGQERPSVRLMLLISFDWAGRSWHSSKTCIQVKGFLHRTPAIFFVTKSCGI